ncbi:MAG: transglycosylase domain-containing protein [Clostridiales bacterium]|nr:transglycosylase domain-containing protein [Clostridiales bacterium]
MKRTAIVFSAIIGVLSALLIAALIYYFAVTAGLRLNGEKLTFSTDSVRIYDSDGELVQTASKLQTASFQELPQYLSNAFVAVEDKRFYEHNGFDYKRIGKAVLKNVSSFSFREGASTISQQLIKNTHLSSEKTIRRKLKEFKLTRALEAHYSKENILELYLNSIYFGHSAFGIESASEYYFGKSAKELSPAESAMLAALVKSPNRYSPFRDKEKCLARRNFVLKLMNEQGYLSDGEYKKAINEALPKEAHESEQKGNSYCARVYEELFELFPDYKSDLLNLRVYTYLDSSLQATLEQTEVQSDICALVRDNKTHALKAYYSTAGTISRLPASTIKPLLVYAPAIQENVIAPATPILDEQTDFNGYCPSNYGGKYHGYVSARYALAHSVNVPAVKILNALGVDKGCEYLKKMNLNVEEEDYSLSLALGGMKKGFPLSQLADAYATFANEGEFSPSRAIQRVEDENGKLLYEHKPISHRVFSADVSFLINDMLQTAASEGTAKTLRSLSFPVCAKTGTNGSGENNVDAYTISYTRDDTVAVWLGNRDNLPVTATGGGLPANIALKIYRALYSNQTPSPFAPCSDVEMLSFDREEYENNHNILLSDPAAPRLFEMSDYFRKCAPPQGASTRFSRPVIQKPSILVKNGAVQIVLCHTEYYDYIVKRENKGKTEVIYKGKFCENIYDNSVKAGESYVYTVIPVYNETEGEAVVLPPVKIAKQTEIPNDWWE